MDPIISNVEWLPIIVGAVLSFAIGSVWYSPLLFGKPWMKGVGMTEESKGSMLEPMLAQAAGTFLLSWLVGISASLDSLQLAALIACTCGGLIKANGLWVNKSRVAVAIEAGFVLVMVAVMVGSHAVL